MTSRKRCSFCRESLGDAARLVTSPLAVDLIAGFAEVRKTTICQPCVFSFASSTVRVTELSVDRSTLCQFCGQARSGALLSGEGIATLCTDCAATLGTVFDRYTDTHLPIVLCPRMFLSYSHESDEHKAWVIKLAAWMRYRNIAVAYDFDHQRGQHHTATTEAIGIFIQYMQSCHAFVPIITPTYLFSIGHGPRPEIPPGKRDPQWVFDEFQLSLQLGEAKRIETIPILRAGEFATLPRPFDVKNTLDLRTTNDLSKKLNRLGEYLLFERACKVVPFLDDELGGK